METSYHKSWSHNLQRDMEYKVYGTEGRGVLVFPSQDQRFYEWEDNGMIDCLSPHIEAGEIHIICCDSIDKETWSDAGGDYNQRINLHERWFIYITDELIPRVNNGRRLIVTGCSMGGYHAGNIFFRHPELFDTMLSLSGLFHADYFFPGYDNSVIHKNSPLDFLTSGIMPPYLVEEYKEKRIICCCGQGEYEGVTSSSTRRLGEALGNLGVSGWFDFWGSDVSHDFTWWRKQAAYFFGIILNEGKVCQAA